jgi:hypothetical protein
VSVCLALALVPWVLVAAGVSLPLGFFAVVAVVAVAPVVPVVAWSGVGSALFLTAAAASRVASRSARLTGSSSWRSARTEPGCCPPCGPTGPTWC